MTNAFISSTGKDLADYRNAAIETCNRLGITPIAMEFFEAMGVGATEGSKRQLDKANLYIGIFAHRYGFTEQGYTNAVTEIEFDYAGERKLDRLCFLVESDYPWPPDLIDYENYSRLQTFKDKINSTLIRAMFTTVDNFKANLMQSLIAWQKEHGYPYDKSTQQATPRSSSSIAPPRPTLIIGREEVISDIKYRLGVTSESQKRDMTIIRGWPGVGKTTLVNTLAYDEDTLATFSDGILWVALGKQATVFSGLTAWGHQLGLQDIPQAPSLEDAITQVRTTLQKKRMLLIVDDVWEIEHAIPCKQVRGSECALVFTTRFPEIAHELANVPNEDIYHLNILSKDKALELLHRLTPTVVKLYPDHCRRLVDNLEGLPLALRIAGRLLERDANLGVDVRPLIDELSESRLLLDEIAPDDRFDPQTGLTPTLNLLLKHSTDRLDETTRECFAMLGVFAPKPATFGLEAMAHVWKVSDPLPTVRKLVDQGLLEPIIAQGRFQMHAVLTLHARYLLEK